ncbi:MAG: hypothetical protein OXU45_08680 [Candidatus Melainabacteria bacterium]|nr:hypothetical protein [Candidatus Melainabacteria bacterium]
MKRKFLALLTLFLIAPSRNSVRAHAGEDHLPEASSGNLFAQYIDVKFEIVIDDAHAGHFFIRKAKKRKGGNYILKLDQTFHLDPDITIEAIKAAYNSDGLLTYTAKSDDGETFHLFSDFNEKDGEDNIGSRVRFLDNNGERMVTVEEIVLRQVVDSETGGHH